MDAALGRLGGNRDLLGEISQFYLEDAPGLLEQVRHGLKERSAPLVERGAHSLKGLSASFSAERAVEAAREMETLARDGNLEKAENACPALEAEVTALMDALRQWQRENLVAHHRPR
ncbi:MAG TPA: Hpt domain-containing protein [Pirellulales bacterium]|nr:Hpt domain-containing protein [Pirellulales bacterium]